MTLKELALAVGASEATLSRLENDRTSVTTDWLERLAGALDVSAYDLLSAGAAGRRDPEKIDIVADLDGERLLQAFPNGLQITEGMADPVACRVLYAAQPFARGDFLIAERQSGEAAEAALGKLVFGLSHADRLEIGRLSGAGGVGYWLLPEGGRGAPTPLSGFHWLAVVRWILRPADA